MRKGWNRSGVFILVIIFLFSVLVADMSNAFQPGPMITFTFDDGSRSIHDNVLPILAKRGLRAVFFGETGPLNAGESWVMTWAEVRKLQNVYRWEIGSHSVTHPYLTQVSDEQLIQELKGSKEDFAAQGIHVRGFATPYGDWDTTRVLPAIAKHYAWHRAAWGGVNVWPYNDYQITAIEPGSPYSFLAPEEVSDLIDEAIDKNQWIILLFHAVVKGTPQPYQYSVKDFKKIIDYVVAARNIGKIKVVTISEALNLVSGKNLVCNPSFEELDYEGYTIGWWRDENVSIDVSAHGNYPETTNSLKIVGGLEAQDAWTDLMPVDGTSEYLLKMFQNVFDLSAGGWAVWIDEFDRLGYYLGGQWLGGNYANFFGSRYYEYQPSSSKVRWVSLVIFTEEGSWLTLYVDSIEFRKIQEIKKPGPRPR